MMQLPGQGRLLDDESNMDTVNPEQLPGKARSLEQNEPPKEAEPEGWLDWAKRVGSQQVSVAAERIGGLPGDIRQGVGNLALDQYEKFGWGLPTLKEGNDFLHLLETDNKTQREAPKWMRDMLLGDQGLKHTQSPTSNQIRGDIAKATGGYTEPKNYMEEKLRNFTGDIIDLSFPGNKMTMGRKAFVAGGSEALGDIAMAISGDEKDKIKAKGGSALALSILNPGGARQHVSDMYKDVRQQAGNATAQSAQYVPRIQNFINNTMQSGIHTDSTRLVVKDAQSIIKMINKNNGRPPLQALLDLKLRINENRGKFYATSATSMERQTARTLYRDLMHEVDSMIDNGLNQLPNINPKHAKDTFNEANQAWSTLHDVEASTKFWKKHMPKDMRGTAVGALLEQGFAHPGTAAKAGVAAMGGMGIILGARVLHQILASPTLRRYYTDALKAAAKGNVKLATTLASKLTSML